MDYEDYSAPCVGSTQLTTPLVDHMTSFATLPTFKLPSREVVNLVTPWMSSLVASAIVYPIDVIKTRRQVTGMGVMQCVKSGHLYRGLAPNLFTYPTFWAVYFALEDKTWSLVASTVGSAVSNPLFVIKNRAQISGRPLTEIALEVARSPRVAMAGLPITCLNNAKLIIQLPLVGALEGVGLPIPLAAASGKIAASLITYPIDLIRTRQRTGVAHVGSLTDPAAAKKLSVFDIARDIWRSSESTGVHRIGAFYRGFWPYTAMTLPNFVIMMSVMSYIKRWNNSR